MICELFLCDLKKRLPTKTIVNATTKKTET